MTEKKQKQISRRTVRVETISTIDVVKENTESTVYKLVGQDSEKLSKVTVTSPDPFNGVNPGQLVDVVIFSSQTSLDEFNKEDE